VPLGTATGLRLLVANDPAPFLFDVDHSTAQPVTGLPADGDRVVWVLPVGNDTMVVSDRSCNSCRDAEVYRVRHGTTVATRLGAALYVVAARDGRAVWRSATRPRPAVCCARSGWTAGRGGPPGRSAAPPGWLGRPRLGCWS
jgi:hypothetical protein